MFVKPFVKCARAGYPTPLTAMLANHVLQKMLFTSDKNPASGVSLKRMSYFETLHFVGLSFSDNCKQLVRQTRTGSL